MRSCGVAELFAEFDIQFREEKSVFWFLEAKITVPSRLLRNYTYKTWKTFLWGSISELGHIDFHFQM